MKKSFLKFQNISDSYSQVNIFPQMSKAQEYEGCNLYVVAFSPCQEYLNKIISMISISSAQQHLGKDFEL